MVCINLTISDLVDFLKSQHAPQIIRMAQLHGKEHIKIARVDYKISDVITLAKEYGIKV